MLVKRFLPHNSYLLQIMWNNTRTPLPTYVICIVAYNTFHKTRYIPTYGNIIYPFLFCSHPHIEIKRWYGRTSLLFYIELRLLGVRGVMFYYMQHILPNIVLGRAKNSLEPFVRSRMM